MEKKTIFDIDKNMKENTIHGDDGFVYYDLNNKYLMGKANAEDFLRIRKDIYISENVEELKRHPAGVNICFKTNSANINIKASLSGKAYMAHMTAVGTVGFSLYVKEGEGWLFLNSTKVNSDSYVATLEKGMDKKERDYRLYFPLYQALNEAYVGIDKDASIKFHKLRQDNVVIYGTSISQGGCATRPGMDYGSIFGRLTDTNVINLGFSGSCKLEENMVDVINDINKKALILELEANAISIPWFEERFSYFINHLKDKDKFNIYLISHFDEAEGLVKKGYETYRKDFYNKQKQLCNKFKIKFIDGTSIIKSVKADGSVDGVHLTDLGFYVLAQNLAKKIKLDKE